MMEQSLHTGFRGISGDHEFKSFEDFCEWAEGKVKKGYTVYKLDVSKPHSRENSYWYYHYSAKPQEPVESPLCRKCGEVKTVCDKAGCVRWKNWFAENWDRNICGKRPEVLQTIVQTKEGQDEAVFRYYHPDDIREGRV